MSGVNVLRLLTGWESYRSGIAFSSLISKYVRRILCLRAAAAPNMISVQIS